MMLTTTDQVMATSPATADGPEMPEVLPVERRAARAAEQLRLSAPTIERLPFDLSTLEDGGILINVDTRNFGLLDRRLDWQALGIALPRGTELAFRPPRCGLIPDRYRLPLLRPAAQAHSALHAHSYRFQLVETVLENPAYRWLPWRAWPEFERAFQEAQSRLDGALDVYESDFPTIHETLVGIFRQLATESARRLQATGHPVPIEFVDLIVRGMLSAVPTPAILRERLSLRFRVGVLQLGSELWAEQRRAAEQRRLVDQIEGDRRIAQQQQVARERLLQDQLWTDQQRLRRQREAEEQERRREAEVKEQLRQLKLNAARERLQEVLSPLEEGAQQLHAAVYAAAVALRTSLQKHQALRGSSARRVRSLRKWFSLMNFTGDDQLEQLIGELHQLATAPVSKGKRDPKPIDQVLGDIIALTYDRAREVAEPNRMAGLEL